ncbi:MAG: ATP-binding protein [Bacillota bacterium]
MHNNHFEKHLKRNYHELLGGMIQLTIFHDLRKDPCVHRLENILRMLTQGDFSKWDTAARWEAADLYYGFAAELLKSMENSPSFHGGFWKNYFLDRVLEADNVFSRAAEKKLHINSLVLPQLKKEMQALERLYRLNLADMENLILGEETSTDSILSGVLLKPLSPAGKQNNAAEVFPASYHRDKSALKQLFDQETRWGDLVFKLEGFWQKWGAGNMGRYWVFKWDGEILEGIERPDPIRLNQLVGMQTPIKQVYDNTAQFVKGYSANNILLYGDRGTGKSSTVKGLIHEFGEDGLRLINVSMNGLIKLPNLLRSLGRRPQRFIIFIDDLSFEEYETQYKELKAVLEGGVEVQPKNVLIYATSNRRHLVKEYHNDRQMYAFDNNGEEIRIQDTLQEKLSLSDRFGVTVMFASPVQKEYLNIVRGLAADRGITMEQDLLDKLALQWELMQNSRSGRTARQFIDHLTGKLAMEKKNN